MLGSLDEFELAEDAIERGQATAGDHPWLHDDELSFAIADAPNFAARLAEAGIDPARFRRMPRLSVVTEQETGAPAGSVRDASRT